MTLEIASFENDPHTDIGEIDMNQIHMEIEIEEE